MTREESGIAIEGLDALGEGARSAPRPPAPAALESRRLFAYVLDADEDLAQELHARTRFAARQVLTARRLDAEPGGCDLSEWLERVRSGPGLLIIDGLLADETHVAGRTLTELLGAGDLLQPPFQNAEEMLTERTSWRALSCTRFALLDGEFAERARPWPALARALLRRAERRAHELNVIRAISCQPRLELRLVLYLWHIAARWGRVEPGGLRVSLPLTHRLLGQLVGAERPSVSYALGRLARAGVVTGTTSDLHLRGSLEAHVRELSEHNTPTGGHRQRHRGAREGAPRQTDSMHP